MATVPVYVGDLGFSVWSANAVPAPVTMPDTRASRTKPLPVPRGIASARLVVQRQTMTSPTQDGATRKVAAAQNRYSCRSVNGQVESLGNGEIVRAAYAQAELRPMRVQNLQLDLSGLGGASGNQFL